LYEKVRDLTEVWKTYEWLSRKFKKEIVVVDGVGKVEEVEARIIAAISKNTKARKLLKDTP
jgi:thymidylate kinase